MTLSYSMQMALASMVRIEHLAADNGTCPHSLADGSGEIAAATVGALLRRGLAERARCFHGSDCPEIRLTDCGRDAANTHRR